MPQSFEQHFAQQPEKEKSLEQIKEEKALLLAEKIMVVVRKEGKYYRLVREV